MVDWTTTGVVHGHGHGRQGQDILMRRAPGKKREDENIDESSAFSWPVETRIQDLVAGIRR